MLNSIGNPTTYRGNTLAWTNVRRLESFGNNTYEYGADGIRTSKTVNGVKHNYTLNGNKIIKETFGSNTVKYFYGTSGVVGFNYNGTDYYYRKNLQGDILAIVDASGSVVVEYSYDAWGTVLSVTGILASTIGAINPFRYRGYYYDTETKLYYLNSRYYDPEIGRFINADDVQYLGENGDFVNYNLFAYCENNPTNRFDENGNWSLPNWAKVTIGVVAIVALAVVTAASGLPAGVIAGAALTGAISGGVGGAITGAISGGLENGLPGVIDGACDGFLSGVIIGGAFGALTSGLSIATGTVKVIGSAQKTGTVFHRAASNIEAGKMSLNFFKYSKITLNRSLNTAGLSGRRMPDVIGVTRNGASKLIEVVSKSQTYEQMATKCMSMAANNPGATYKVVEWAAKISRMFNL